MRVYADNAATTRMSEAAFNAMLPLLRGDCGNPSSLHGAGRDAARAMEAARGTTARLLGAQPEEIYFTSGGTEADNWAAHIAASLGKMNDKRHIISTKFEHHAMLHSLEKLEKQGFEITLLDVYEDGIVRPDDLRNAIRSDTVLVSVMYANNEIGTIQPISELGEICRERGVLLHTDAVQAVGHVHIDVKKQNIDLLSLSAHKFHGPKGVGALYCRKGIPLATFIEGGAQERGKRAGTENVPGVAGMAAALEESCEGLEANSAKLKAMRYKLISSLCALPRVRLNGHPEKRLPGNVNLSFEGIEGEALLLMLDSKGICASSGSACTSGSLDPSHVLLALGLPHEIAHGSLRLSLSGYNTMEEIDYIIEAAPKVVERLRAMSPVWEQIDSVSKN